MTKFDRAKKQTLSPRQQEVVDDMKVAGYELFVMEHVSPNHAECGDRCRLYRDGGPPRQVSMTTFYALIKKGRLQFHSERGDRRKYILAPRLGGPALRSRNGAGE